MKFLMIPADHVPLPINEMIQILKDGSGREMKFGVAFCSNLNKGDEPMMLFAISTIAIHRDIFRYLSKKRHEEGFFSIEMGLIGGWLSINDEGILVFHDSIADDQTFPKVISREDILTTLRQFFGVKEIRVENH